MDVRLGQQATTTEDKRVIPHRAEESRPLGAQVIQARLPIVGH